MGRKKTESPGRVATSGLCHETNRRTEDSTSSTQRRVATSTERRIDASLPALSDLRFSSRELDAWASARVIDDQSARDALAAEWPEITGLAIPLGRHRRQWLEGAYPSPRSCEHGQGLLYARRSPTS